MNYFDTYRELLQQTLGSLDLQVVEKAAEWLREARDQGKHVFVCGNAAARSLRRILLPTW